ncbi:MAG TPA: Hsp70 family protein [Chryseosolibacter sp.]
MKKTSCGIDFGTSNSSVALEEDGNIRLVPVEESHVTIPSALFYPPDASPLFGRKAIRSFIDREPGRFMRSLKRVLGTSLMKQGTVVNGKVVKFDRIIGSFLAHLRTSVLNFSGDPVENVVMGRPVHFVDNDPAADHHAQQELHAIAKAVGFKNIEFQFEPIAAAFAHEARLTTEQLAIVADLGGGTSDFTVIRLSQANMKKADRSSDVLANTGVRIGGNDFDKALSLSAIMKELGYRSTYGAKQLEVPLKYYHDLSEWSKVNFLYTPKILSQVRQFYNESHDQKRFGRLLTLLEQENGHRVLSSAEESKIALTNSDYVEARMDFLEDGFFVAITRPDFELAIAEDVQKVAASARDCIRQAGVTASTIQLVILTGGSTEIPAIQACFKQLFPAARIADENKLSSVGLGLAYDAARRFR